MNQEAGASNDHQNNGDKGDGGAVVCPDVIIFDGHPTSGKVGKCIVYGIKKGHTSQYVALCPGRCRKDIHQIVFTVPVILGFIFSSLASDLYNLAAAVPGLIKIPITTIT